MEYVRRLVTENKDLRMLMNKYIKVSKGGLKNSMFQEPQERGDTSEKVYGILNKVINIFTRSLHSGLMLRHRLYCLAPGVGGFGWLWFY